MEDVHETELARLSEFSHQALALVRVANTITRNTRVITFSPPSVAKATKSDGIDAFTTRGVPVS